MPACSVKHCNARKNINKPKLSLHRFPVSDVLRRKWLDIIGTANINRRHKKLYVCSLHFEESCFNRTLDVVRLHDNTVPSLSLGISPTSDHRSPASTLKRIAKKKLKSTSETETDSDASKTGLHDDHDDSSHSSQRISMDLESGQLQEGYYCNGCNDAISGFRYICVHCSDFDLCNTCEAKGLHELHYMLRAPKYRSHEEITAVLEKIREELFQKQTDPLESIKVELKQETDPLGEEEEIDIDILSTDNQPLYEGRWLGDNEMVKLHGSLDAPLYSDLKTKPSICEPLLPGINDITRPDQPVITVLLHKNRIEQERIATEPRTGSIVTRSKTDQSVPTVAMHNNTIGEDQGTNKRRTGSAVTTRTGQPVPAVSVQKSTTIGQKQVTNERQKGNIVTTTRANMPTVLMHKNTTIGQDQETMDCPAGCIVNKTRTDQPVPPVLMHKSSTIGQEQIKMDCGTGSIKTKTTTFEPLATVPMHKNIIIGQDRVTNERRTGSIVTLNPITISPLMKRYVVATPGRRFLNTTRTDADTSKQNRPDKS